MSSSRSRFLAAALVLTPLVSGGCAVRRNRMTTNVQTSVSMQSGGERELATLSRDQYSVMTHATGRDVSKRWFVLWFPVGSQKTSDEVWDGAYADAVASVEDCDAMLLPRTKTQRFVVPLLLVNVVVKRQEVTGRCVRVRDDAELTAAPRPSQPRPDDDPRRGKPKVTAEAPF